MVRDVLTANKKKMNYNDRIKMLAQLGQVGKELPMMERFAIFKYMYLTSFTPKEMTENVRLVMAKEMIVENVRIYGYPILFIGLNPNNLEANPEQSYYFSFDKDFHFTFYNQKQLQEQFDKGIYKYLSYFDQSKKIGNYSKLPGINKPNREY